jgi:hypothetical protein
MDHVSSTVWGKEPRRHFSVFGILRKATKFLLFCPRPPAFFHQLKLSTGLHSGRLLLFSKASWSLRREDTGQTLQARPPVFDTRHDKRRPTVVPALQDKLTLNAVTLTRVCLTSLIARFLSLARFGRLSGTSILLEYYFPTSVVKRTITARYAACTCQSRQSISYRALLESKRRNYSMHL